MRNPITRFVNWLNCKPVNCKKHRMIGAQVVKFYCEGCMASDHRFEWIGSVYAFEPAGNGLTYALVKVLKSNNRVGDIRDGFCGHERIIVENARLQEITPKLFFYYT